jgi:rRNA maturation endonuclease Nob1
MAGGMMVGTLHVPLERVALCVDCETCFEISNHPCPACGSRTWVSVARLLNRRRNV